MELLKSKTNTKKMEANTEEQNGVAVIPLEQKVDNDFNLEIVKVISDPSATITSLKEKYMVLKVTDKVTFRKAEEARKDVKNVRIIGEKICDAQRSSLEEKKKAWIKKKEQWSTTVGEIEDYLSSETDAWKAAEQKKKDEEARLLEEEKKRLDLRLLQRQQELGKYSVLFADNAFLLGDVRYSYEALREADDDTYQNEILPAFKSVFQQHEQERLEKEKERKEAEEKQRQEAEQLRLEQEQLKKEQEEMKQQRYELRMQKFASLGMDAVCYLEANMDILGMSNDDFKWFYDKVAADIQQKNKAEEELKEKERIAEERKSVLQGRFKKLEDVTMMGDGNILYGAAYILTSDELVDMPADNFEEYCISHNKANAEAKAEEERKRQEEEERRIIESKKDAAATFRQTQLSLIDFVPRMGSGIDLREMSEEDYEVLYKKELAAYEQTKKEEWLKQESIKKEQEQQREKERLAELSENKRWKEWVEKKLIPFMADIPVFESKRYVRARAIATEKIEEIITLKPGNF